MLRAPTGAGKTDAALLWAQRQITTGRADRLVWAMPTRFTANALYLATTEQLSNTGIYHSSAWHLAQKRAAEQLPGAARAAWRQELDYARLLETAATVTTIDQLCMALTASREDHHATFWNLAHACLVIDEADFYDDFTQRNLVVLLRALRILRVPVLLMSATLPESARELYNLSGSAISKIWDDPSDSTRTRLHLHRAGRAEFAADVAAILERGLKGEPLIIYANTVGRAQGYWDWFQERKADNVVLYHSRFTEPDKEQIEQKLLALLGPKAWEQGKPCGVAILTQIGELSVNISADLMLSDLCPTDRLAQRAGRLSRFKNRFDKQQDVVGELYLIEPEKTTKDGVKNHYPAPYGHYRQGKGWIMSAVLEEANKQLVAGEYSAQKFVTLVNALYPKLADEATEVHNNRAALEDAAITNWLLLPQAQTELDDDDTHTWKSRDISPQKVVYANTDFSALDMEGDRTDFPSWFAFQEWALPRAISIAVYDFKRAQDDSKLTEVLLLVNEEREKIWVVKPRYYDAQQGLRFDKAPSDEDE
ncbi:CRISPR-associated helicase Cas3' [Hymenobacter sp. BRD67]|uniref:CRISPR-associated helicase Cas3' n=1 Tax=Hymenobacter sp. BRD67 TaxID=2675877 RepID=UPI001566812B|nr:CRISPR-associated helicase Cas3' [Hymenobacter sp. BRD67]QKG55108.1 CRISPR-associated helicase Cas3' [Hymenobacter sp. BRD67]